MVDIYPLMEIILGIFFIPALGVGLLTSLLGLLLMLIRASQQSLSNRSISD